MQELKIHGVYKHFKGDYYLVEDIAKDSETKEEMVLYRRLYEDCGLWVRPKEMFYDQGDVGIFRLNHFEFPVHVRGDTRRGPLNKHGHTG